MNRARHEAAVARRSTPRPRIDRTWLFLGPAFVAAVAYVDPGNFATNIQAGSELGYQLVWVVVAANLSAMVIQTQSAKPGLVSGRSLPEHIRDGAPHAVVIVAWIGAEIVAMATDLAELLGAGLGLSLLTGIALFPATVIAAAGTVLLLGLQRRGAGPFEAVITTLIGVIAVSYLAESVVGKADLAAAVHSFLPPRLTRRLAELADRMREGLEHVQTVVADGPPTDAILAASDSLPADLIVLVTHAHTSASPAGSIPPPGSSFSSTRT